ncbi:MAG: outer membrane beta-barrel domain-containing protein [Deltaproteobacteria bacterium]|nr:outer membrane beta-barrel domain-containing protein [Deltaproteobacteria bacterium]
MKHLLRIVPVLMCAALLLPASADAAKRKTTKKKDDTKEVKVEEVGILQNDDVRVVQKMKYVKAGNHEIGFLLSAQPWDAYTGGAMLGFDLTLNATENIGVEIMVQGGYGWANGHYRDVSHLGTNIGGELTGLAADARRQIAGGSVNVVWSPIYAKLAWGSQAVVHFDIYGTLGAHGYLNQQLDVEPKFGANYGPSIGLGMKFFLSEKVALKFDVRDHISLEVRKYTGKFTARNNFQVGLGLAFYLGQKK